MNRVFQSAPFLLPAVALVVGIVAGDRLAFVSAWWVALVASLAAVALTGRWPRLQSAAVLAVMVALGGVRASSSRLSHDGVSWPDGRVRYEAVIVSEPAVKPKSIGMDVVICGDGRRLKCYVADDGRSRQLKIGDRIEACSHIDRNSEWQLGAFDYRRYLEVHGFSGQAFVRAGDWRQLPGSWQGLSQWQRVKLHFLSFRHTLLARYRQLGIGGEEYAVVAAMTLGDKSAMSRELRQVYTVSGASHVLALSGLHLGIIYMILSLLVVGHRFRLAAQVLILLAIWAFALLVGMPPSVVRSAVMISVYALFSLVGRNRMSLNALALAALCILMVSPDSLFDVGFQLSFLAMLAILTVQPVIAGLLSARYLMPRPILRWLWGLLTVSVAAQVGVAPLIAYYFGHFSTYFLLTNLVVIPITMVILYLALFSFVLPVAGGLLATVVSWLNAILSAIADRMPCASIELHPTARQTAMVYLIVVCVYLVVMKWRSVSRTSPVL